MRGRRRPLFLLLLLLVASWDQRCGESPGVAGELARSLRRRGRDHPFEPVFVLAASVRCLLRPCLLPFSFAQLLPWHLPASGERQAQPQQLRLGAPADPPLRPRDPAA